MWFLTNSWVDKIDIQLYAGAGGFETIETLRTHARSIVGEALPKKKEVLRRVAFL